MKLRMYITERGDLVNKPIQKQYLAKFHGKHAFVEVDMRTSVEKQRFIEGAIVKYFFYQHLPGVYKDYRDARNGLKWAVGHTTWELDANGEKREVTRSMSEIYASNRKSQQFIDKCNTYFMQNGYEFPDSDHYNEWENSGPKREEEYPPLDNLKKLYFEQLSG